MNRRQQTDHQPPPAIDHHSNLRKGQFLANVAANVPLCREHFRLILLVDRFPATKPGQFIQISCREVGEEIVGDDDGHGEELIGPVAMLRRPFSLAGRRDTSDRVELEIIHRVVGVGTDWLARLKAGDDVSILGPLGNVFELPKPEGMAILVGGGVGIPPMIYLAEALAGRKAVAFAGALSRDLLPLTVVGDAPKTDSIEPGPIIEEFARHGIPSVVTTDDGSFGFRGFVTQALEKYLDSQSSSGAGPTIYTCGPEPMMKRVAEIAAARNIECQVAVERAMACGMGTCQSCCIRVRKPDASKPPLVGKDWCYRLACTDGPIFRGADLLW